MSATVSLRHTVGDVLPPFLELDRRLERPARTTCELRRRNLKKVFFNFFKESDQLVGRLTLAGKVTNEFSALISLKMAEQS